MFEISNVLFFVDRLGNFCNITIPHHQPYQLYHICLSARIRSHLLIPVHLMCFYLRIFHKAPIYLVRFHFIKVKSLKFPSLAKSFSEPLETCV